MPEQGVSGRLSVVGLHDEVESGVVEAARLESFFHAGTVSRRHRVLSMAALASVVDGEPRWRRNHLGPGLEIHPPVAVLVVESKTAVLGLVAQGGFVVCQRNLDVSACARAMRFQSSSAE